MIAPDVPAPSYIHKPKTNNAVVPSIRIAARAVELFSGKPQQAAEVFVC
jgi:hypothetical protein